MVKKVTTEIELQVECIRKACSDLAEQLVDKTRTFGGSVFKEIAIGGKLISPLDALDVGIAGNINVLQKTDAAEPELCGNLILKSAFRLYLKAMKEAVKEAKDKEYGVGVKDAVVKARKARRDRIKDGQEASPTAVDSVAGSPLDKPTPNASGAEAAIAEVKAALEPNFRDEFDAFAEKKGTPEDSL